jgi:Immunity protein 8
VKAKVKSIVSADPLWDSGEAPSGSFCVDVWVLVGPEDGPGEESFEILVCNPSYLADQLREDSVMSGRHHLFVNYFNRNMIEEYLRRSIERIEGATWVDVAERVGRIGHWEFEDYVPAPSPDN